MFHKILLQMCFDPDVDSYASQYYASINSLLHFAKFDYLHALAEPQVCLNNTSDTGNRHEHEYLLSIERALQASPSWVGPRRSAHVDAPF